MIQELISTSAQRCLNGNAGFGIVAQTVGMAPNVSQAVNALSGYTHIAPPDSPRNPAVYLHAIRQTGGMTRHIVSRVADCGNDYSGRSNRIAHHWIIETPDTQSLPGGPGALIIQDIFRTHWNEKPAELPPKQLSAPDASLNQCSTWERITGDGGWGRLVAERASKGVPISIVFPPECSSENLRALISEALALLPSSTRWKITFSTYYMKSQEAGNDKIQIKCFLAGSEASQFVRQSPNTLVIDLQERLGAAPAVQLPEVPSSRNVPRKTKQPSRGQQEDWLDIPTTTNSAAQITVPLKQPWINRNWQVCLASCIAAVLCVGMIMMHWSSSRQIATLNTENTELKKIIFGSPDSDISGEKAEEPTSGTESEPNDIILSEEERTAIQAELVNSLLESDSLLDSDISDWELMSQIDLLEEKLTDLMRDLSGGLIHVIVRLNERIRNSESEQLQQITNLRIKNDDLGAQINTWFEKEGDGGLLGINRKLTQDNLDWQQRHDARIATEEEAAHRQPKPWNGLALLNNDERRERGSYGLHLPAEALAKAQLVYDSFVELQSPMEIGSGNNRVAYRLVEFPVMKSESIPASQIDGENGDASAEYENKTHYVYSQRRHWTFFAYTGQVIDNVETINLGERAEEIFQIAEIYLTEGEVHFKWTALTTRPTVMTVNAWDDLRNRILLSKLRIDVDGDTRREVILWQPLKRNDNSPPWVFIEEPTRKFSLGGRSRIEMSRLSPTTLISAMQGFQDAKPLKPQHLRALLEFYEALYLKHPSPGNSDELPLMTR